MYLGLFFLPYPFKSNELPKHRSHGQRTLVSVLSPRIKFRRKGVIVIALLYRIAGRKDKELTWTSKFRFNNIDYCVISALA